MPHVQTKVSREQLAELHRKAILGGESLRDLLNRIITNYLKEDLSWQTKKKLKLQKDREN